MQLMGLGFKLRVKNVFNCLAIFLLLFSLMWAAAPGTAVANTGAGSPAKSLVVNINDSGEIIPVHTYTIDEMTALTSGQVVYYSSIDSMPAPVVTIARGVTLNALVADINAKYSAGVTITPGTFKGIKLYATDSWSAIYTYDYLYGATRYYYPELVNKWDSDNQVTGPGSSANPVEVEPMLAVYSYQSRFLTDLNPGQMLDPADAGSNIFRFCFGQTASDIANSTITNSRFGKWVNRLDILLPDRPAAPALTADSTDNNVGHAIEITFTDDAAWRNAITGITVNGGALQSGRYTVAGSKITIDADVFGAAGAYTIVIKAQGYKDATAVQKMVNLFQDWPAASTEPVPGGKTWTIRFSQPVSTTPSLHEHIYVTDASGKRLDVTCEIATEDQKSIKVVAPNEGYRSGESCTLWVKGSLRSATGKQLKQPVKMQFKIS